MHAVIRYWLIAVDFTSVLYIWISLQETVGAETIDEPAIKTILTRDMMDTLKTVFLDIQGK